MRRITFWMLAVSLCLPGLARAQEQEMESLDTQGMEELTAEEDAPSLIDQVRKEAMQRPLLATPPLKKYPHLDWHGYFRFRADLFGEADLGTFEPASATQFSATSHFLPPLIQNDINAPGGGAAFADQLAGKSENTVGTANLRLRLAPVIRITDGISVGTTVDLLDNIVLGSTPEYLTNLAGSGGFYSGYPGASIPLDTFTRTQIPPAAGVNAVTDSIVVKEAFAQWKIGYVEDPNVDSFSLGTLKLGRYAWDWGLGIHTSRGDYDRADTSLTTLDRYRALDAEWGDYLDRAQYTYDFGPLAMMAGYGWLSSGPTSRVGYTAQAQPYDLEQEDDIYQVELALYSRPESPADHVARKKQLFSGRPVIDWGLYVTWRRQVMASRINGAEGGLEFADYTADYNAIELVNREAWVLTPDLWMRLDWRPTPGKRFYAGVEAVMSYGQVTNPTGTPDEPELDVVQYGAALETNVTLDMISFGLDGGFASGDDAETMALFAGQAGTNPWGSDNTYSTFTFNRNYIVDMLLYREVLGGISNSAYVRPHFDFDIIPTPDDAFGGALAALWGFAMDQKAYPGDSLNLGLELDATVFYEQTDRFLATAGFGVLFPFGALDRPENFLVDGIAAKEATWAWTLQGNLFFVF